MPQLDSHETPDRTRRDDSKSVARVDLPDTCGTDGQVNKSNEAISWQTSILSKFTLILPSYIII
jgi:hypothetical protein